MSNESSSIYLDILRERTEPILYEDDGWFVLLAKRPCNEGHLLIIPKTKEREFFKLPSNVLCRGFEIATKFSAILSEVYQPPRVAMFIKGFTNDDHVHIHITPAFQSSDLNVDLSRHQLSREEMFVIADRLQPKINDLY